MSTLCQYLEIPLPTSRLQRSQKELLLSPQSLKVGWQKYLIELFFLLPQITVSLLLEVSPFLESALTCISLVKKIVIPKDSKLFLKAKTDAKKAKVSKRIFILGNLFTFPLAMYCAAKFYEILGYDAHYSRIEQFSHMELFSVQKGDTVIIFEEKNTYNKQLGKNLMKVGINVIHPRIPSKKISQMVYCTFFSQLVALFEAKKKRKKDCHFVTAKKIRNVSNQMIY